MFMDGARSVFRTRNDLPLAIDFRFDGIVAKRVVQRIDFDPSSFDRLMKAQFQILLTSARILRLKISGSFGKHTIRHMPPGGIGAAPSLAW